MKVAPKFRILDAVQYRTGPKHTCPEIAELLGWDEEAIPCVDDDIDCADELWVGEWPWPLYEADWVIVDTDGTVSVVADEDFPMLYTTQFVDLATGELGELHQ